MPAACNDGSAKVELPSPVPDPSVRPAGLTRLYDTALRGLARPDHLSKAEIQDLCYAFAANCYAAGISLPAQEPIGEGTVGGPADATRPAD